MLETLTKTYLIIPFIVSFLGLFKKLSNPITTRRVTKFFFLVMFFLVFLIAVSFENIIFQFLNVDLYLDKFISHALFLNNFIFLLLSIYSKNFIKKRHKSFYLSLIVLFGITNISILSDNIFVFLLSIFWMFLIFYTQNSIFSNKNEKITNRNYRQIFYDIFCIFISLFLISFDFARYFIINDINFTFSNIPQHLSEINDFSTQIAFFGFAILIIRLFNLLPFQTRKIDTQNSTYPLLYFLQIIVSLILGSVLFVKTYLNFDYIFFEKQTSIAIFILINFIYYIFLSYGQNDIFKFLSNTFKCFLLFGLFSIFSFEENCFQIFFYLAFILCLSYLPCIFISMKLIEKSNTFKLSEMKKINDKSKLTHTLILTSYLNISLMPILPMFSAFLICGVSIFCVNYKDPVLNFAPFLLAIGIIIVCFSSLDILRKILLEPCEKNENETTFSFHQLFVFAILFIALITTSLSAQYFIGEIDLMVNLGN